MMMLGKVATGIINGLKAQPLVLALVVVNVLFLIGCAYGLREISASAARRDTMLADEIAKDCTAAPKGDRLKP
jgi:hypothetical protein